MKFDFKNKEPVVYIVHCYEQIPKDNLKVRESFLSLFLERSFIKDGKINIGGGRSYTAVGEGMIEGMLTETIEELEPIFYTVCEKVLGYRKE